MTADDKKSAIPVCCICGTQADAMQKLAIGMLKRGGSNPKAYCLRCWAKRFPEIAARQAEQAEQDAKKSKKKRPVVDSKKTIKKLDLFQEKS